MLTKHFGGHCAGTAMRATSRLTGSVQRRSERVETAMAVGGNRSTCNSAGLSSRHQKVLHTGDLFLSALHVEHELSRKALNEARNKTLRKARREHQKLLTQLAEDYQTAIAERVAVIRDLCKRKR